MTFADLQPDHREERRKARTRTARKWARITAVALAGMLLAAIWQEERLAPPVHARLQQAALAVQDIVARSDSARQFFTAMTGSGGGGGSSSGSPVVGFVLKLNQ